MIAGGWAVIAAGFRLSPVGAQPPGRQWHGGTLVVVTAVAAVVALVAIDAVRAWRRGQSRSGLVDRSGLFFFGPCAWLIGGLLESLHYVSLACNCGGTGGDSSFECLHRPGSVMNTFGWLSVVSVTPLLVILFFAGRRSRVAAWLSPALIAGLYLLAACLWEPHTGLGVPDRTHSLIAMN